MTNPDNLHTCRTCTHCAWKNQYCAAMDTDLGKMFMNTPKACPDYEPFET